MRGDKRGEDEEGDEEERDRGRKRKDKVEMKSAERSCGFIDRSGETPFSRHMLRSLKGHYTTFSHVTSVSNHQRRREQEKEKKNISACFIKNHE